MSINNEEKPVNFLILRINIRIFLYISNFIRD